ncbi:hypothetical protein NMYAN_40141 [Nitrosomonas nitrosa]|uniref:Uncharacterized protein n=1 Tax=Nitrosomonas nitrosa TaxID=52442 RepID=A0A8H8Z287_9PROT|nr:hypothetical protein NMYAN_40141 [Nitrosomonas nitrosa]
MIAASKGIITAEIFPLLNQAVHAVAQQTRIDWLESVEHT